MSKRILFVGTVYLLVLLGTPLTGYADSASGAFWRSLIAPGWGQSYLGAPSSRFVWTEIMLWGSRWALLERADVRAEHFRSHAVRHANIDLQGKSRQFLDDIGFYESRLQHDRYAQYEEGPEAAIYGTDRTYDWFWDSEESRARFRDLRNGSRHSERQALYLVAGLITHRIVSAIHAAKSFGKSSNDSQPSSKIKVYPSYHGVKFAIVSHL